MFWGYIKHLLVLETTNSQTLQTGTAVTGLEKSLYKRAALKVDPPPSLALGRERAHDPTCFSSFSCWNADRCSIFSRQTLDRQRNVTRGINAEIPIGPSHLKDKEVDYWMCVFAQLSASGWRPAGPVMAVSRLKSLKSNNRAGIYSEQRRWNLTAHREPADPEPPRRSVPVQGACLKCSAIFNTARPKTLRELLLYLWWSFQLTSGHTTSQTGWLLHCWQHTSGKPINNLIVRAVYWL